VADRYFLVGTADAQIRRLTEMQKDDITYYEDGEVIFEENSVGKDIYAIEDGKVEISLNIGGQQIAITTLEKGDLLGEIAALTGTPRSAMAKAVGKVALRTISLGKTLADHQSTIELLQTLAIRLRNTTAALRDILDRIQDSSKRL
jgi:CRP-like cAMP-binding protein